MSHGGPRHEMSPDRISAGQNPTAGNHRSPISYHTGPSEPVQCERFAASSGTRAKATAGRFLSVSRPVFPLMNSSVARNWESKHFPCYWVPLADFMPRTAAKRHRVAERPRHKRMTPSQAARNGPSHPHPISRWRRHPPKRKTYVAAVLKRVKQTR